MSARAGPKRPELTFEVTAAGCNRFDPWSGLTKPSVGNRCATVQFAQLRTSSGLRPDVGRLHVPDCVDLGTTTRTERTDSTSSAHRSRSAWS